MTSRTLQYFMLPSETAKITQEVVEHLGLHAWLISGGTTKYIEVAAHPISLFTSNNMPVYWVALSETQGDLPPTFTGQLVPAKWGWILVEIPRQKEDILYLAQMSAKSDWYDSVSKQIHDNNVPFNLFRMAKNVFERHLLRPVYIREVGSEKSRVCKGLCYSRGIIELVRSGTKLRQEGVEHTEFDLGDVK
jgi:hypothetical protein